LKLVLASRNRDKIREMVELLRLPGLEILDFDDFESFPVVEESGRTLEENALHKAEVVSGATGEAALADDTGLEVDALGGAPGVFSARFAGPGASYADNVRKLLSRMQGTPDAERGATFRCVVALFLPSGKHYLVEGSLRGKILEHEAGTGGFGYDPVFYVPSLGRTFAELEPGEKNTISHRALAMRKAARLIKELLLADPQG